MTTTTAAERTFAVPRWLPWVGIVASVLGLWSTLPPIMLRTAIPAVLLCLVGLAIGIVAIRGGVKTQGWWSVTAAVLCGLIALRATEADPDSLKKIMTAGLLAAMLRFATPLTLAALGGLFSERAGVVNIGLEGTMLFGAFFGMLVADKSGSWIIGLVGALVTGALVGLLHGLFCIHLQADQIVVGTGINILALGATAFVFRAVYGFDGSPPNISQVPNVSLPGVRDIPFVGAVIGDLNLMVWLTVGLVALSWWVLWRTPIGLRIRAVGEHPRAAETVGINVYAVRYLAVMISGMLAALGGAYLSIAFVGGFTENMTNGRGFIALAVMILGKWKPVPILGSAMVFGLASALADRIEGVSPDLLKSLPYVVTLVALVGFIGRATPPAADGKPYARGGH